MVPQEICKSLLKAHSRVSALQCSASSLELELIPCLYCQHQIFTTVPSVADLLFNSPVFCDDGLEQI